MSAELSIYTLRPDGTALYVPEILAESMGLKRGDQLTAAQYDSAEIQGLIGRRIAAERGRAGR